MAKRLSQRSAAAGPLKGPPPADVDNSSPRRRWRSVVVYLLVFAAAAAFFAFFQFQTPDLVGFDGYYHIKYSYVLRTQGWRSNLPWLEFTIYKKFYRDHHLLFHLLLIPFTLGGTVEGLRVGAKLAATLFPTLMAVSFFALLRAAGVPRAWLWTIALPGAGATFLYRMLMPRPMAGALALLLLAGVLLIKGRHRALAVLTGVGVWYYDGYGMIVLLAFLFFVARWLVEGRLNWRPLVWCLGGAVSGILVNVYFPRNIASYAFNLYRSFSGLETAKGGGTEWFQLKTWPLIAGAPGAMLGLLLVALAGRWCRRVRADTVAFILMTAVAFLMVSRAQRYMEYYPAVALVAAALTVRDLASGAAAADDQRRDRRRRRAALAIAILMAATPLLTVFRLRGSVVASKPYHTFRGAADYIAENSNPGDLVFNVDYDDFTHLFFHNHKNHYLVGLDPIYLDQYDSRLFELWRDIRSGKIFDIRDTIKKEFDPACRWVVVETRDNNVHPFTIASFKDVQAGKMRRVFQERIKVGEKDTDRVVFVYELVDRPRSRPPTAP